VEAFNAALKGGKFDEAGFVEQLTAKTVRAQQAHDTFNAKQLIDVLQRADAALRRRTEDSSAQSAAVAVAQEFAESAKRLRERAGELRDGYERLYDEFRSLDQQVARVSSTAARIGERLDTLEQHRRRAAEIIRLLQYFAQLNSLPPDPPPSSSKQRQAPPPSSPSTTAMTTTATYVPQLDSVFTDSTQLLELARVVRLLAPVARELDSPATARGKREVEKLVSKVETALLDRFFEAESAGNLLKMKEAADAMTAFNGGDSLVSRFIQTRSLFTDAAGRAADDELARSPPPLLPPTTTTASSQRPEDARLTEFCNKVLRALQKEHGVVLSVFPKPPAVMSLLVQKVLELRVRPFVDALVYRQGASRLEYVRTLHAMHGTLNTVLFAGLKQISGTAGGAQLEAFAEAFLASYLWPCTPDGQPHPNSYIAKEIEAMTEIYSEGLRVFDRKKRALEKLGLRAPQASDQGAMPGEASDELVSIQTVLEFVHANEAAIGRCTALSRKTDLAINVGNLFRLLLQFVFLEYVDDALARMGKLVAAAINTPQSDLSKPNHAVSSFNRLVQVVTQIVVLIQRHYKETIVCP